MSEQGDEWSGLVIPKGCVLGKSIHSVRIAVSPPCLGECLGSSERRVTVPLTTYICGHTWKTGIVARNEEEEERLKKIVERWSQTEKCAACKMQDGTWKGWSPNSEQERTRE